MKAIIKEALKNGNTVWVIDDGGKGKFIVMDYKTNKFHPEIKSWEELIKASREGDVFVSEKAFCQYDTTRHDFVIQSAEEGGLAWLTIPNDAVKKFRQDNGITTKLKPQDQTLITNLFGISCGNMFNDTMACAVINHYTHSPQAVFAPAHINNLGGHQVLKEVRSSSIKLYVAVRITAWGERNIMPLYDGPLPTVTALKVAEEQALLAEYKSLIPKYYSTGGFLEEELIYNEGRLISFIIPMLEVIKTNRGWDFFKEVVGLRSAHDAPIGPWRGDVFFNWMGAYIRHHHKQELIDAGHTTKITKKLKTNKKTGVVTEIVTVSLVHDSNKMTDTATYKKAFRKEFMKEMHAALHELFDHVRVAYWRKQK